MGLGEKVYFTGYVDDNTLRALYRVADVTAFPSRFEPFGIVALEAMAAKVPVVVSHVGGLAEIVEHEETGLHVPRDDPEALATAIERILRDEDLKNRIVKNAYEKCLRNYNWDRIAEQTLGIYNKILNEWISIPWKPT